MIKFVRKNASKRLKELLYDDSHSSRRVLEDDKRSESLVWTLVTAMKFPVIFAPSKSVFLKIPHYYAFGNLIYPLANSEHPDFKHPTHVLHELSHWQICGKVRRNLPDYGLGSVMNSERDPYSIFEEKLAIVLTTHYVYLCGFGSSEICSQILDPRDGIYDEYEFEWYRKSLVALGLLTEEGMPTYRLR